MGDIFNGQIAYLNATQSINSNTSFAVTNTYYELEITPTIITNTSLTTDIGTNSFKINSAGTYLVQYRMSFIGGANDEYKIGFALDDEILAYTEILFSTKGSNMWEVQNLALINMPISNIDNKGFGTSQREIKMYIKNTTDATSIILKNASFVIIRIQ